MTRNKGQNQVVRHQHFRNKGGRLSRVMQEGKGIDQYEFETAGAATATVRAAWEQAFKEQRTDMETWAYVLASRKPEYRTRMAWMKEANWKSTDTMRNNPITRILLSQRECFGGPMSSDGGRKGEVKTTKITCGGKAIEMESEKE